MACQGDTAEPKAVGEDAILDSDEASFPQGIAGLLFIVNALGVAGHIQTPVPTSPIALLLFDFGMPYI